GAVIWVFLAEIFPTKYRSKGQSLGSFAHWINAALISTFFPEEVDATSPQFAFFVFAAAQMVALAWVICFVPETKGVPLEDIGKVLGFDVDVEDESEDDRPMLDSNSRQDATAKYTDVFTIDDEEDNDVFIDEEIEMGKVVVHARGHASTTEKTDTSSNDSDGSSSSSLRIRHAHDA
ncbi:MAG: hypothetical protein SGILL_003966, partial [Bacillariaceae sp.]